MDGQLVTTHGRQGRNLGELDWPLLTGSDEFNNILIAGHYNQRIDVLKPDGELQSLPVVGLGQYPMCARVHMDKLYVVLWSSQTLQVFSIGSGEVFELTSQLLELNQLFQLMGRGFET